MTPIQHFDIRLTPQELDLVANALAQGPWGQVNALLMNIKAQVDYQQKVAAEPELPLTGAGLAQGFGETPPAPLSNGQDH